MIYFMLRGQGDRKQEIEDVIGDLEVPDDVLFFFGNRCTNAIETEP